MNINTAIFLGAGASKAEGAPLQGELFREYFGSRNFRVISDEMDDVLASFFLLMFGIDVKNQQVSKITFPTFEEVLGLTDLAVLRKETFFFSSRRRHTRSLCDWSSDVCSSD